MREAGASEADVARELAKRPAPAGPAPDRIELDAAKEGRAVLLFLAMGTQWRTAGMAGVRVGLDYTAIEATARMAGVRLQPRQPLLAWLRELEGEALTAWSEQRARGRMSEGFVLSGRVEVDAGQAVGALDQTVAAVKEANGAVAAGAPVQLNFAKIARAVEVAVRGQNAQIAEIRQFIEPAVVATEKLNEKLALAEKLFIDGRITREQFAVAQKLVNEQLQRGAMASATQRAGMQQLGMQFGDFTQQVSLGINPMVAFGQQAGQAAYAASMMGGAVGKVGTFFAGPWGAIILAATTVVGTFAYNLLSAGDASEKAGKSHKHHSDAAKSLTETLAELDRVSGAAHKTAQQLLADSIAATRANVDEEISLRNKLKARLEGVRDLQRAGSMATGQRGEGAALNAPMLDAKAAAIDVDLARQDKLIAAARTMIAVDQGIFTATQRAAAATSVAAAATQAHERAVTKLTADFTAHRISLDQLTAGLIAARLAEDKANSAKGDAARASREAARAAREQAKAIKEADDAAAHQAATFADYIERTVIGIKDAGAASADLVGTYRTLRDQYDPLAAAAAKYADELERIALLRNGHQIDAATAARWETRAGQRKAVDDDKAVSKSAGDFADYIEATVPEIGGAIGKEAADAFGHGAISFSSAIGSAIGGHLGQRLGGFASLLGADAKGGSGAYFQAAFKGSFDKLSDKLGSVFGGDGKGFADKAGKAFAGASQGAIAGGVASALGVKTSGAGSQLGGAIGSLIPQLGPFGGIIGGAIGGVLGGMLAKPKFASATVSGSGGAVEAGAATGNSAGLRKAADALGSSVGDAIQSLVGQLGGEIGDFAVSVGQRNKKFVVDGSGKGATKGGGVQKYASEAEAVQAALADAIRDGAVSGVSPRVQAVLGKYADNVNKAVAEALKVKGLEDLLANDANPFSTAFRDFEYQAKQRLDAAKKYGFDVLEIERINAQDRAKLIKSSLDTTVASAKSLLDSIRFGDRAEGDYGTRVAALTAERDRVAEAVRGGDTAQLDKLSSLAGQLLDLQKEGYGSTGAYAAGRDETTALIEQLIRQTQDRVDAASKAALDAQAAPDPQLTELNATADDQAALQQRILDGIEGLPAAIAGALAGGASRDLGLTGYTRAAVS